eukprot:3702086-Pleurochrysis_carterae.AAC.2
MLTTSRARHCPTQCPPRRKWRAHTSTRCTLAQGGEVLARGGQAGGRGNARVHARAAGGGRADACRCARRASESGSGGPVDGAWAADHARGARAAVLSEQARWAREGEVRWRCTCTLVFPELKPMLRGGYAVSRQTTGASRGGRRAAQETAQLAQRGVGPSGVAGASGRGNGAAGGEPRRATRATANISGRGGARRAVVHHGRQRRRWRRRLRLCCGRAGGGVAGVGVVAGRRGGDAAAQRGAAA